MMACDSQAGLEAQKLISLSLGKMAASRMGRTGASLHKSLQVASVLHRARHVFLEESYHVHRMAHPDAVPQMSAPVPVQVQVSVPAPTPVAVYTPLLPPPPPPIASPAEDECAEAEDKENQSQEPQLQQQEPVVESARIPLSESNNNNSNGGKTRVTALKRRRCVSQQETQDAVWSILPKRPRTCSDENTTTETSQQDSPSNNSMEVEHITSLVSIFSFGGQRVDMCGTEAAREELGQYQPVALAV